MPLRALAHLRNLGKHAFSNTRKTTVSKIKNIFSKSSKNAPGKENKAGKAKTGRKSSSANVPQNIRTGDTKSTRSGRVYSADTRVTGLINATRNASNAPEMDNVCEQAPCPLQGVVFIEAADIDGDHETAVPRPPDSDSEEGNNSDEDPDCACPSFRYQPDRGVGVGRPWEERKPPSELQALDALEELEGLLRPRYENNKNQKRYKQSKVSGWTKSVLEYVRTMLRFFTLDQSETKGEWGKSAKLASAATGKSARTIKEKAREFIRTQKPPDNPYGTWSCAKIEEDEVLKQEIGLHLQGKGKYVKANDIVIYLNEPEVKQKWGLKKTISTATAKRWMKKLGYRWVRSHKGLYADGHERDDVKEERKKFLKTWYEYEPRMHTWTGEDADIQEEPDLAPGQRPVVPWFHDETIYYAHDRRQAQWVHEDASPTPYTKGEGYSMMDAEFASADYGFGRSPDGTETARVIFKPGKNRDGYFDNEDILKQATVFMDILEKWYPNEEHLLIYGNATTHKKRADTAPSARRMPKFTPKEGTNWGVEITDRHPDGTPVIGPDGKAKKIKVKMDHGYFHDGTPQDFYFPEGHERAGIFKGMAVILEERGYNFPHSLRAECVKFKCPPDESRCCCRRLLYMEPDFVNVKSLLEEHCAKRGFKVIFLPKFHCELNFLEMVWGKSKRAYRLYPPSSKEDDLRQNMLTALESVNLTDMRKFARRSRRFMRFYHLGLDGKLAAWANKKFRGHRVTPEKLMEEMDKEGIEHDFIFTPM
ncbi:hypothetical protein NLJ89_g6819 [Agrocybe chaxingu]|uniref:Uncharacterized protein n=1 Tax=Agrocybe chaxingu TaxID=84603 RepID=A0A9W8MVN3_9AGAR|nr:hypothetical protein NLJ89_g6819 [Agrocybe chaxingu]